MILVRAKSATSALLSVGELWLIEVETRDLDGFLVDGTPVVTVTLPSGTTSNPTFEPVSAGRYRASYVVNSVGRHVAHVTTVDDAVDFAAYVAGITTNAGMPTVDDVARYLRESAASWSLSDLQDALDEETDAQRAVCRIKAVYPRDLRGALLRRVQVNLAVRQLPLAVLQGDAEAGNIMLPGSDPYVRNKERPHRKRTVG